MKQTIVAIVGPTATGKTAFALQLARQILAQPFAGTQYSGVDIISVDSRQVYAGLEILSGADIPPHFSKSAVGTYTHETLPITLHGVSMRSTQEEWSVAHFKNFAVPLILRCFEEKRIPLLVGGTGLYHQQLFQTDPQLDIPPDNTVREKAEQLTVAQLQNWLSSLDEKKLENMNNSDRNNPRRLSRAIEIAVFVQKGGYKGEQKNAENEKSPALPNSIEMITYGMNISLELLQKNITKRVQERFESGALDEVRSLQKLCQTQDLSACSCLGVKEISEYLAGNCTQIECQELWALHEFQYAKRQLTWFKKQKDILWLDDKEKKAYTITQ